MGVKIKINGRELETEQGKTVLQVALEAGIYIPHYCYHPQLSIKGSCRMCLVYIEKRPKLEIACNTRVEEGMVVETETEEVKKARQAVLEFMLKNHPVDCPICDKAGECLLQDYYMIYDRMQSRLDARDGKVKKGKRISMGPTLVLDQERCIMCQRCIRFMREVARNECLTDARRGEQTIIVTFPGEVVDDPYSLCLTDICPVGAWTSKDFRFKKRVWFLTKSPSICPFCARGCNIFIDHENQVVYRIRPRENQAVNQSWDCDEGRLAYKALNDNRLSRALLKEGSELKEVNIEVGLSSGVKILGEHKKRILGIISASASLEEADAFKKLIQGVGGEVAVHKRKPGKDDFLLKRADRDSNLRGFQQLGIDQPVREDIVKSELLVVLESLYSEPVDGTSGKKMVVLSPKRGEMVEKAILSLPIAAYAETEGSFVNFEGITQKFYPALGLKGDAKPGVWVIKELAKRLGVEI